jgi:hypothetical protein
LSPRDSLRATRAISSFRTEAILGMVDYFYWVLKRRLLPALPTRESPAKGLSTEVSNPCILMPATLWQAELP